LLSNFIRDVLHFVPACRTLHKVQFTRVVELLFSDNWNVAKSVGMFKKPCNIWLLFSVEWTFSPRIWSELRRASQDACLAECQAICLSVTASHTGMQECSDPRNNILISLPFCSFRSVFWSVAEQVLNSGCLITHAHVNKIMACCNKHWRNSVTTSQYISRVYLQNYSLRLTLQRGGI
jgi:hypothetical protein